MQSFDFDQGDLPMMLTLTRNMLRFGFQDQKLGACSCTYDGATGKGQCTCGTSGTTIEELDDLLAKTRSLAASPDLSRFRKAFKTARDHMAGERSMITRTKSLGRALGLAGEEADLLAGMADLREALRV